MKEKRVFKTLVSYAFSIHELQSRLGFSIAEVLLFIFYFLWNCRKWKISWKSVLTTLHKKTQEMHFVIQRPHLAQIFTSHNVTNMLFRCKLEMEKCQTCSTADVTTEKRVHLWILNTISAPLHCAFRGNWVLLYRSWCVANPGNSVPTLECSGTIENNNEKGMLQAQPPDLTQHPWPEVYMHNMDIFNFLVCGFSRQKKKKKRWQLFSNNI